MEDGIDLSIEVEQEDEKPAEFTAEQLVKMLEFWLQPEFEFDADEVEDSKEDQLNFVLMLLHASSLSSDQNVRKNTLNWTLRLAEADAVPLKAALVYCLSWRLRPACDFRPNKFKGSNHDQACFVLDMLAELRTLPGENTQEETHAWGMQLVEAGVLTNDDAQKFIIWESTLE